MCVSAEGLEFKSRQTYVSLTQKMEYLSLQW